jgi:uncharacterized membrane protein YfcA
MIASKRPHRMWLAGAYAAPIGILSGLTGLGGAEFRLPVIAGIFGYPPRTAVPIDLSVSLFTLTTSLIVRSRSLSLTPVVPLLSVIAAFIVGASITSFIGPGIAARLSDERLRRIVLAVMTVLGIFLIYQSVYPLHEAKLFLAFLPVLLAAGLVGGLLVGIVSSTAGVAGGELQIALLVLVFGVDIKTAGTASLCMSLPMIVLNVSRYVARGAITIDALRSTIVPMGIASIVGAIVGGTFAAVVPVKYLRVGLGILLIVSSQVVFRKPGQPRSH